MSLLLSGAHVVTMDDTGSEHEDGWVLLGLVLHTHLAETVEEEAYCRELFGRRARPLLPAPRRPALRRRRGDVRDGRLVRADEEEIARLQRAQARRFAP